MSGDDRLLGEVVGGRFRLERKLGEGGMGAVYEAVHVAIGSRVAVKLLRPAFAADPAIARRFLREARTAAAVAHEGVIRIQDFGQTASGAPYLVMDLLSGESLADRLGNEGRLGVGFSAYVGCHVLAALDAAHRAGVVHRDLKPENIFLVATKSPLPDVKVLDFGISKVLSTARGVDEPTQLTATGVIMGTPEYMSPEHAAGRRDVDGRTDLYAVGAILYECVTGRVPFDGATPAHVLSRIHTEKPRPPRVLWPELPEGLEAVILRALEKRPEDRFGSAWEMFVALQPFVERWALARLPVPDRPSGVLFPAVGGVEATATTIDPSGLPSALLDGLEGTVTTPTGEPGRALQPFELTATTPSGALPQEPTGITSTMAPTEVTNGRRRPSRVLLVVGGLALVAAISAGAAVGVATVMRDDGGSGGSTLTVRQMDAGATPRPRGGEPADPVLPTPSTPEPERVTIDLEGVPEGARVILDEAVVSELPITLARGSRPRRLRVEAEGFEPFEADVDPSASQTLRVTLAPRRTKRPTKTVRPVRPTEPEGGGEEPVTPRPVRYDGPAIIRTDPAPGAPTSRGTP